MTRINKTPQRILDANSRYRAKHRERLNAYRRDWYKSHKKEQADLKKKWRQGLSLEHLAKIRLRHNQCSREHPETNRKLKRKYRKELYDCYVKDRIKSSLPTSLISPELITLKRAIIAIKRELKTICKNQQT